MNPKKRIARKRHSCSLCHETIEPTSKYQYERITPWDHPDNESYFDYKAHLNCHKLWMEDGGEWFDWNFPLDGGEWDCFINDLGLSGVVAQLEEASVLSTES